MQRVASSQTVAGKKNLSGTFTTQLLDLGIDLPVGGCDVFVIASVLRPGHFGSSDEESLILQRLCETAYDAFWGAPLTVHDHNADCAVGRSSRYSERQ